MAPPHLRSSGSPSHATAEDPPDATAALLPVTRAAQIRTLLTSFLTVFIAIGTTQAYPVLLAAYQSPQLTILPARDAASPALLALIGTLGAGLTWAGALPLNPILSRTSQPARITTAGALILAGALGLASTATRVWHLVLTQGLLYGLGNCLFYFPALALAPEHFAARRGTAMGVALSGAGLGAVAYSLALEALLARLGTRWALRALALANLALGLPVALACPRSRFPSGARRRRTRPSAELARSGTFVLSMAAALLGAAGSLIPVTFLASFSAALGGAPGEGATLVAVFSGVNAAARVAAGLAGDALGRQNALIASVAACCAAVGGAWLASVLTASRPAWLAFVVLYSVAAGGYNALLPSTVSEVFGLQAYASVNGFLYFFRGVGYALGSPLAGALLEGGRRLEDYRGVVVLDLGLLVVALACLVGVRWCDAKDKGAFKLKA